MFEIQMDLVVHYTYIHIELYIPSFALYVCNLKEKQENRRQKKGYGFVYGSKDALIPFIFVLFLDVM